MQKFLLEKGNIREHGTIFFKISINIAEMFNSFTEKSLRESVFFFYLLIFDSKKVHVLFLLTINKLFLKKFTYKTFLFSGHLKTYHFILQGNLEKGRF